MAARDERFQRGDIGAAEGGIHFTQFDDPLGDDLLDAVLVGRIEHHAVGDQLQFRRCQLPGPACLAQILLRDERQHTPRHHAIRFKGRRHAGDQPASHQYFLQDAPVGHAGGLRFLHRIEEGLQAGLAIPRA
ncbi:hypothetical protein G6F32_016202 [Rhizopus arrhizus]|nr:hypothetical protein G6F32_016202 [Rhizopus arrhizus]